ncbi:C40 family peptidase [Alkalibacillus aidingensis]|uniref:hypothetical protein n=1 Tax=Alkalibacillus aidingensis TaxID=2747607 RepID=UPI00166088CA|nr:hypothetical protein [Alkalibacillus aidingensis]
MSHSIVSGTHSDGLLTVKVDVKRANSAMKYLKVYKGDSLIAIFPPIPQFHLGNEDREPVTVICVFNDGYRLKTLISPNEQSGEKERERVFKPGDILVACDNAWEEMPPGYMGHSAIVVDEKHTVEANVSDPEVRMELIEDFIDIHPMYMHIRCKNQEAAQKASNYAVNYLRIYNGCKEQDLPVPPFSFSPYVPLDDPWSAIYCSKLVWLSYYYGAGIKIENDHFLFAPEDIATKLENDPRFEVLYKHKDFEFKIDL